jgi:hypothetical protein
LKGGKGARRSPRAGKRDGKVTEEKKCLCCNDHQNSLPEYRLPTEAEWVGQRSIISIRDRKISLVRKLPVLEETK